MAMRTLRNAVAFVIVGLVTFGGVPPASAAGAQPDWYYGDIVDFAFVRAHATVPMREDVMIIDSRPARKYDVGHISPAVNIPERKLEQMTDRLPADKATTLVFYCGGYKCKLSAKSATKAVELGYTNVKLFQAGYPSWVAAYGKGETVASQGKTAGAPMAKAVIRTGDEPDTITFESFEEIVAKAPGSVYLIDVRDPEEFGSGSLPTAKNMTVDEVEEGVADLPADKPIIFICSTGARSGEAYDIVKLARADLEVYFLDATVSYAKDGSYKLEPPA
jgi:rhodanese-related sulfurtransferase